MKITKRKKIKQHVFPLLLLPSQHLLASGLGGGISCGLWGSPQKVCRDTDVLDPSGARYASRHLIAPVTQTTDV